MWRGWSIQSPHGRAMKKMEISYLWESVKIIIFIAKWPCKSELQNNVENTFFFPLLNLMMTIIRAFGILY